MQFTESIVFGLLVSLITLLECMWFGLDVLLLTWNLQDPKLQNHPEIHVAVPQQSKKFMKTTSAMRTGGLFLVWVGLGTSTKPSVVQHLYSAPATQSTRTNIAHNPKPFVEVLQLFSLKALLGANLRYSSFCEQAIEDIANLHHSGLAVQPELAAMDDSL